MAYVKTDVPFYSVNWYVNGTFVSSSYGGHEKTEAWFYPNSLTGSIKGVNYTIKAKVMRIEDDGTTLSDTDSYIVRAFQPKYVSGIKNDKPTVIGVNGSVTLSRHYHDGSNIVVDGSAYARNGTENACNAKVWFRQTEIGGKHNVQDPKFGDPNPSMPLPSGGSYYKSGSSAVSYHLKGEGGNIGDDQRITLNAHIHLQVDGNGTTDVWHDNNWTHTFTYKDNKDYIGE